jgi:hypothetical protein
MKQIKNVVGAVSGDTLVKVIIPSSPFLGQEAMVPVSALGGGLIKELKATIPSAAAAQLATTPFVFNKLDGTILIVGGLIYLSPDATESMGGVGSFQIKNRDEIDIYKSASIARLDPGNIMYISPGSSQGNVASSSLEYSLTTTSDSVDEPGADLYVVLYYIDASDSL